MPRAAAIAIALAATAGIAGAQPAPSPTAESTASSTPVDSSVLKVCSDANNLPQSDDKGQGYENKIAATLAHDLKRKIEYTYFPQRMGFVRNTLRAQDETTHQFKCDVIIGVPKDYDLTATTQPYMRSTYAIVVPASAEFRDFKSAADVLNLPAARLRTLRIGIFARTPGSDWVLKNNLLDHATLYAVQSGDPNVNPQSVVGADLTAAKIDAAIVWGPVAGFLVNRHTGSTPWVVLPFKPDPQIRFDYELSMGVRLGEKEWRDTLDRWIGSHHADIKRILSAYHVPLLDEKGELMSDKN
jgi:quinoprotein dehydrogenase-associated probable ABC transporter substrate-binding protein